MASAGSRIKNGVKQAFSLEGLIAAIVGGGVWLIVVGVISQLTAFTMAASVAVGAGAACSQLPSFLGAL